MPRSLVRSPSANMLLVIAIFLANFDATAWSGSILEHELRLSSKTKNESVNHEDSLLKAIQEKEERISFDKSLSALLEEVTKKNAISRAPQEPSIFSSIRLGISISDYIIRFRKYLDLEPMVLISALVYIDRFLHNTSIFVDELNVHRIFLTATVIAYKFFEDIHMNNSYLAKLGGIPLRELNRLEVEFLYAIRWDLAIDSETFDKYTAVNPRVKNLKPSLRGF